MKTYTPKPDDITRGWFHVDATGLTLGRLAVTVADILRGKHKASFAPSMDAGDFVIITNAEKIAVTGQKLVKKTYVHHTGFPGGFREKTLGKLLAEKPTEVLEKAIWGMMPHNRIGRQQFTKLKVYAGPEHPHAAQQPKTLDINSKGERKWR